MTLQPGRGQVKLPSGRTGVALTPLWVMPLHTLVLLDGGERFWVLTELLKTEESSDELVEQSISRHKRHSA